MGLRLKIFLPLLLSSLLLGSYLYGFWLPRLLADAENAYQGAVKNHLDSVAEGLVPLLLGRQLDGVYGNLDALLKKHENWVSIELFDPKDRLLYPLDALTSSKGHKADDVRTFKQDIRYLDTNLGNLVVKVSLTEKLDVIRRDYVRLFYLLFIVVFLFFLTTGFILELLVRRPIKLLADASQRFAEGDFEMPLPRAGNDEIGTLMKSFVTMRDAIGLNTGRLSDANEQLRIEVRERKQAEEAIRESEEKFRVLAEKSPNMIFINKRGRIVYANEKCEEVMGYTRDEFRSPGFDFLTLIAPESLELVRDAFGRQMNGEDVLPFEYAIVTKQGTMLEVIITSKLIDLAGETAILGIITDITDRKNMENELREFSMRLEVLVKERTAELEKEVAAHKRAEEEIAKLNEDLKRHIVELEEARILAEAGIRARGAFLANISHELITPLNSIIGFSQILIDGLGGPLNEQQKEYAASILQGGNRLHETLKEIVQFAGLESGEMQLHAARFLLKDLLKASLLAFNERAAVQGVTLSLEIGLPPETELEADRIKLHQVMFNLLDNAVKFTPEGGSVRVSAHRVKGPVASSQETRTPDPGPRTLDNDLIEISVADTGIGIKEDDLSKLFRSFEQLEAPYTKTYRGTGLGLILAQKLIELHGGKIWVESEFGKGSTFVFVIPIRQNPEVRSQEPE